MCKNGTQLGHSIDYKLDPEMDIPSPADTMSTVLRNTPALQQDRLGDKSICDYCQQKTGRYYHIMGTKIDEVIGRRNQSGKCSHILTILMVKSKHAKYAYNFTLDTETNSSLMPICKFNVIFPKAVRET